MSYAIENYCSNIQKELFLHD